MILINSKSINNISNIYQIRYQSDSYDLVLAFCDTDKSPSKRYRKIKRSNYEKMKENVSKLSANDEEISSTNILKFIENFESDDDKWIDELNNKLMPEYYE